MVLLALAWWLMIVAADVWHMDERTLYLLPILGAAWFAVGLLGRSDRPMARTWQVLGVAAVLAGLVGPSFEDFAHVGRAWYETQHLPTAITAGILLLVMFVGYALAGASAIRLDWPMALAALVSAFGLGWWLSICALNQTSHRLWHQLTMDWWLALATSAVMLAVAIWLIVRGVRKDRAVSFFAGVLYLLLLVLISWVDLIGDKLSSAILFFAAGAVLLITAWFWRKRQQFWTCREVPHA